jgi:putative ABC transport system permease protein
VPLEIAYVDAEYFSTLSQPIIRGRGFDETTASGPVVGVLNEAAAGLFWPDEDAIGKHFTWPPRTVITVTGVAGNAKLRSLRESGRPALYLDRTQQRARVSGAISANQSASIVLRTSGNLESILPDVRQIALEERLIVDSAVPMHEQLDELLGPQRLGRAVLSFLSALALFLSGIGVFGVVGVAMERAEKSISVRRVLGASSWEAIRPIVFRIFVALGLGVVGGGVVAWWGARVADRFLYGITSSDPTSLVVAISIILIVIAAAAIVPLRRSARGNLNDSLRVE